jgi:hypothetical protein
MLLHPSIDRDPKSYLRFWHSFVDLWISPLHTKFHSPPSHSSELVSRAFCHFLETFTFNPIHRLRVLFHLFIKCKWPNLICQGKINSVKGEELKTHLTKPITPNRKETKRPKKAFSSSTTPILYIVNH